MKLDFCDVGRSIAGRPEDPIELRPFEFAFTPEKIRNSCKKLGLSPVHLKTALMHKRVRDDSADGSRSTFAQSLRERHTATLLALGQEGMQGGALEVALPPPPQAPPPRTTGLLASPSKAEKEWKSLKAAGVVAGAIFHSVGAKAFNGPEITGVALERQKEKQQTEADLNLKARSDFEFLRHKVESIMEAREEVDTDYSAMSQSERRDLITYIFQAQGEKGAAKHTSTIASSLEYLDNCLYAEVNKLVADPPCLKGTGRVAKGMSAHVIIAELAPSSVPLLTGPTDTQLLAFGVLSDVDLGTLAPVKLPSWVDDALPMGSESAQKLVGKEILYKWPPRLGGWARGTITAVNTDVTKKVGKEMCNFLVHYPVDDDTSEHLFHTRDYARNVKSLSGSWVLLGGEEELFYYGYVGNEACFMCAHVLNAGGGAQYPSLR